MAKSLTYLTVEQAAKRTKLTPARIRQLLQLNRFPGAIKFAKVWMLPEKSVEDFESRPSGRPPKS